MAYDKKKEDKCPVIGSANNIGIDLDAIINSDTDCDGWCPGCSEVLSCQEVWKTWNYEDLFEEINRMELEDLIDGSITADPGSSESDPMPIDIQCDIEASYEDLPPELQDFLRELQKLIRRTQIQLRKFHANK